MIPASQLTSCFREAPYVLSIHFHPLQNLVVANASVPPPSLSGKLDPARRFAAGKHTHGTGHASAIALVGLHSLPLSNSKWSSRPFCNSRLRSRRGGFIDARRGLFRSRFPSNKRASIFGIVATGAVPEQPEWSQNSRVLASVSELQEKLPATDSYDEDGKNQEQTVIVTSQQSFVGKESDDSDDEKDSDSSDDEDGKDEEQTVVVTSQQSQGGGDESGTETVVQEYKLTEEGTLSSVTVTIGGSTRPTRSKVDRVISQLGMQAELLQNMIRNFSVRKFIRDWGKKEPSLEDLKFTTSMYDPKQGISNISQWTATELTLQRAQMVRIARDTQYLVWAFSLFGFVRILEAVATVFSTRPPNYMKIFDALNALDPLTIASLAHAMRQPIVGMLEVDPTNLEEVSSLKTKFWAELHKFYERQWKVMATLGVARLFTLIVTQLPAAEWITNKVKILWDISMALPIF